MDHCQPVSQKLNRTVPFLPNCCIRNFGALHHRSHLLQKWPLPQKGLTESPSQSWPVYQWGSVRLVIAVIVVTMILCQRGPKEAPTFSKMGQHCMAHQPYFGHPAMTLSHVISPIRHFLLSLCPTSSPEGGPHLALGKPRHRRQLPKIHRPSHWNWMM